MMAEQLTLQDITSQIRELQAKQAEMIAKEKGAVIAEIKEKVEQFNLTEADIFGGKGRGKGKTSDGSGKANAKPKMIRYKDEATGVVWAGRGRKPPEWSNLEKEDIEKFKLDEAIPADLV